jgi:hypothetical protein
MLWLVLLVGHHHMEPPPPGQAVGLSMLPHTSVEEGSVHGSGGDEGYPQDGDGAAPGRDLGVEWPLTGGLARDPVSPHLIVEHRCYHLRLLENGRGSGQRPLRIQHRHLVGHLHRPWFRR